MEFDTKWDVNKYFDETEPPNHWLLRQSFMEAHKTKFSEERLVCLAKTFINTEILNCRYNISLHKLINSLVEDVPEIVKYRQLSIKPERRPLVAIRKLNGQPIEKQVSKNNISKEKLLSLARKQEGYKGKVVIFEITYGQENPYEIVTKSVNMANLKLTLTHNEEVEDFLYKYRLLIDSEEIASCYASNDKEARKQLGLKALNTLKQFCFTIQVHDKFVGKEITKSTTEETETKVLNKAEDQTKIPESNKGAKIMKMMGWTGQGLGKNSTGIKRPIEASRNIQRQGLGLAPRSENFRSAIKTFLKNYLVSGEKTDLVFSNEYTKDERACIHMEARKLHLKSKSYGRDEDRQLVVSRNVTPWETVEELLKTGGYSDKYTLVSPANI